ncbi:MULTISPECIES: SDR family oxidoreductase [unclassified Streptomyces]|uniref:SDR family oxidoreductase n=1 Tax=unclassified Streptomyces TaxID=2593676 RepID=UPI0016612980|nr:MULTISPECIES: SDR family oxidoreductase [unclassified Streptomyces]MBD0711208.1 hypothetical protein [Streptomyces sp. CBMA291]MBD0714239.1 hypothetical protein [Streptomyces sp. CBMA370]
MNADLPTAIARDADLPTAIARDAALGERLDPPGRPASPFRRDPVVLLTGATGYLGGYLARELLAAGAHVWCPVRGPDAAARLRERLSTLGVPPDAARLTAIETNLTARQLGLPEKEYQRLCADVDVIVHCAASVNLAAGYDACHAANVMATLRVCQVASAHRAKPLHHISTLAVYFGARAAGRATIADGDPPHPADLPDLGYPATKLAAELLIDTAVRRGALPAGAVIHRIPMVPGDSRGRARVGDIATTAVAATALVGAVPRNTHGTPAILVDDAGTLISAIALSGPVFPPGPRPLALNHYQRRITQSDIALALDACGHPVTETDPAEWNRLLLRHARAQRRGTGALPPTRALAAMAGNILPYVIEETPEHALPDFDRTREHALRDTLGIPERPITPALLARITSAMLSFHRKP